MSFCIYILNYKFSNISCFQFNINLKKKILIFNTFQHLFAL